jgi:hypothetical protein
MSIKNSHKRSNSLLNPERQLQTMNISSLSKESLHKKKKSMGSTTDFAT